MNMNDREELPHLSITVRNDHLHEDLRSILARVRSEWPKQEIKFKQSPRSFSHGMMNTMVACYVTSPADEGVMCRVHGDQFTEFFSHDNEIDFILLLKKHYDFGPTILLTFDNGFCYDYIVGEPLSPDKLRIEEVWRTVATQLAQMHSIEVPEKLQIKSKFYDHFTSPLEKYPEKLADETLNIRFQEEFPSKDQLMKDHKMLMDHIDMLNIPCVFAHTDSRPENMVWDKMTGKVTFVDFECCGFQSQAFDIAYHFFRYAGIKVIDFNLFPDEDFQREWLKVYLREWFHQTDRKDDVTHVEVEKIRVEVMKTYLSLLLISAGGGAIMLEDKRFDIKELELNIFEFSVACYKEYLRIREDVLALSVPERS